MDENGGDSNKNPCPVDDDALTVKLVITLSQAHNAYWLRDLLFEQGG